VEFCYNTSFHASLKTLFRVIYGRDLPILCSYTPGDGRLPIVHNQGRLPIVHNQMMDRDEFLAEVRDRLLQAQQQYKMFYDHHNRKVEFEVGQWVWLHLLYRLIMSLNV
jgi:hypothetical protein